MSIKNGYMITTMPNGDKWKTPISVIAVNRAEAYQSEFGDSLKRSLEEDTWPLFESDHYEIKDWAQNNMYWDEAETWSEQILWGYCDFEEGWTNGEKEIEVGNE